MAFFQTQQPHEPVLRAPAVVLWLIAALVAAHLPQFFFTEAEWNAIVFNYAFVPARYAYEFLAERNIDPGNGFDQAAPFFTYMFIHAGWGHLIVNSLMLLAFGPTVARRFGAPLFLVFFFACGIAAILVHLAFNWESMTPVVGASGATSGLMAAAIRMVRLPGSFSFKGDVQLAPIFSRPVLTFAFVWALINVIAGLMGLGAGPGPHLIAWEAHMGGFFGGLVLAGLFDHLAKGRGSQLA